MFYIICKTFCLFWCFSVCEKIVSCLLLNLSEFRFWIYGAILKKYLGRNWEDFQRKTNLFEILGELNLEWINRMAIGLINTVLNDTETSFCRFSFKMYQEEQRSDETTFKLIRNCYSVSIINYKFCCGILMNCKRKVLDCTQWTASI